MIRCTQCIRRPFTFIALRQNAINKNDGSTATSIQKSPQTESVPSDPAKEIKDLKFSDSRAYYGVDKRELQDGTEVSSLAYLEAFDSSYFRRNVAISFWTSFAVVCIYFWFSRRDYNGFLNAPKYEVLPTLKRYVLQHQIEEARKRGKDTTYLEASLAYVDVEEAVYKAEEGAFTLKN